MTDLYALVLVPASLVAMAPFVYTMFPLQERWKPVKHRKLVYATCCVAAALWGLEHAAITLPHRLSVGHDISSANVFSSTLSLVLGTVGVVILLRPSLWLSLVVCTVGYTQVAVVGYYSNTFDSCGPAILAGT
jgi:hypothetical protein